MTLLLRLVAKYALWIYVLCGIGMVLYLRTALAARREGGQAIYSLERESAASRIYRSSGMILLLLLIVVGVYALSHYVELPSPTVSPIALPTTAAGTPTQRPPTPTSGAPTVTVLPTSTRRPLSTAVTVPTTVPSTLATAVAPASCADPNVQIAQPGHGQVINEGIQVRGTAQKDQFDRYEFKFKSQDVADEWHWVETFRTPVGGGDLGFWRTSHLPSGNYLFMLIAIDQRGNSQECIVPVVVRH
jgi:hypothetical protein